jgi:hypothetical protein
MVVGFYAVGSKTTASLLRFDDAFLLIVSQVRKRQLFN